MKKQPVWNQTFCQVIKPQRKSFPQRLESNSRRNSCLSKCDFSSPLNMFSIFKERDPIEHFWKWFVENKEKFDNLAEDIPIVQAHKQLKLITDQLCKISAGLLAEVS